mgnify:CR=1 FL=1
MLSSIITSNSSADSATNDLPSLSDKKAINGPIKCRRSSSASNGSQESTRKLKASIKPSTQSAASNLPSGAPSNIGRNDPGSSSNWNIISLYLAMMIPRMRSACSSSSNSGSPSPHIIGTHSLGMISSGPTTIPVRKPSRSGSRKLFSGELSDIKNSSSSSNIASVRSDGFIMLML